MNWEAIGAVGEVVGAIAVIATLLYLSIQLKQNTQSSQSATWQAIVKLLADLDTTEASDPVVSNIMKIAEESPEELTDEQYWKFVRIAQARVGTLEYAFLASKKGTIDEYFWEALNPYANHLMNQPAYRRFWDEKAPIFYHPQFISYMESLKQEDPDDA